MLTFFILVSVILHESSTGLHFQSQSEYLPVQPDDVDSGHYDDLTSDHRNSSICTRTCKEGESPRICYYKWYIENYVTLGWACGKCPKVKKDCFKPQCVSADGFERAIATVNRRLPGPSIQVCKGDTIVVDVMNHLKGSATTVHWHGFLQRRSPWMDGVPMVTQCPILEGQTFRYKFLAEDAGTFWYHSHVGLLRGDGYAGSLVVRQPDSDEPMKHLYDYDLPSHVLVVQDWKHFTTVDMNPGLASRHIVEDKSDTYYLINGRGIDPQSPEPIMDQTPLTIFQMKKSKRYRFRIIAASSLSCVFRISFQGHRLLLIAADKNPVKPITVDSIDMSSGERYDVVIDASQPTASYFIEVKGLYPCHSYERQVAILQYDDSPLPAVLPAVDGIPTGFLLNPASSACTDTTLAKEVCLSQLSSVDRTLSRVRASEPDIRLLLAFGFLFPSPEQLFETGTYQDFFIPIEVPIISLINNISYSEAPSPLLTQYKDVPSSKLCDSCPPRRQMQGYCKCTYVIKLPLNAVVEILMIDTYDPSSHTLTHPFHIHGYDFYVLEQGVTGNSTLEDIEARLRQRRHIRDYLPVKDTVIVPKDGYTVARLYTDNPGFWLYHCHINFHLNNGMGAVFQVGQHFQMLPPPPGFPVCSEFVPPIEDF